MSSTSAGSGTRRRMKLRSRGRSFTTISAIFWSCSVIALMFTGLPVNLFLSCRRMASREYCRHRSDLRAHAGRVCRWLTARLRLQHKQLVCMLELKSHQREYGEKKERAALADDNREEVLASEEDRARSDEQAKAHAPQMPRDTPCAADSAAYQHAEVAESCQQHHSCKEEVHCCGHSVVGAGNV